jgi:ketosteroid isomerase-like protein
MGSARTATSEEVAATYFQSWRNGDIDSVRPLLHPDVDFAGALAAMSTLAPLFRALRHPGLVAGLASALRS